MSIYANFLTDGYVSGFDGLLIREFGLRESSARLAFALTRLAFVTFGFVAFGGFRGF